MNTNKLDAIKMAIKLKRKGLLNKEIVIKLDELGYRNPKTLKPWTKSLVCNRTAHIVRKVNPELDAIHSAKYLKSVGGYTVKQIVNIFKHDGFINPRTQRPYEYFTINKWVAGIRPVSTGLAIKKARDLKKQGFTVTQIKREIDRCNIINERTGKPYSKSAIENWLRKYGHYE